MFAVTKSENASELSSMPNIFILSWNLKTLVVKTLFTQNFNSYVQFMYFITLIKGEDTSK